jgi:hypothetical protein
MKTPRSKKNPSLDYMRRSVDRASDKFVLRLPDGMRDFIAELAERNQRSMNAEIISALAAHAARFVPEKSVPESMRDAMNNAMAERIRQGEIQYSVREMVKRLEGIAKELDQVVDESRAAVAGKKNPPE